MPAHPPNQPPVAPPAAPPAASVGPNALQQQVAAATAAQQAAINTGVNQLIPQAGPDALAPRTVINQVPPVLPLPALGTTPVIPTTPTQGDSAPIIAAPKTFREKTVAAFKDNTGPAVKLGATTGLVVGGASIADLPVLGNIPLLPQAAQWIQNGINSATGSLGMKTGTLATSSWLFFLPNWVGPTAIGGAGLWGMGKLNEWLTRRVEKSGLNVLRTMWNGVRLPYDLPIKTLQKIGEGIGWTYKYLFGDKEHQKPGVISRSWGWTKEFTKKYWRTGAGIAIGAGLLAPATGGSSLVWGIVGGLLARYWDKKGYLRPSTKTAASATTHPS